MPHTIFEKFAIETNTHTMKRTKPIPASWTLLRSARMGQTILLLFLMLLAALTEGFGILMLVPLLESLTSGNARTSGVSAMIWPGAEPLTLDWLLCAMIALTVLRSSSTIQNRIVDKLRLQSFGGFVSVEWRWLSAKRSTDHAALPINNIGRIGVGQAMPPSPYR
jgi:ATP-binding cassette subfamily C protein